MAHPSYQNNGGITAPPLPQVVAAAHVRTLPFAELHELRKQENLNWEVPPIWLLDKPTQDVCAVRQYDLLFTAVAEEWESHCATIGQNVTVLIGDRKIRGRAESLDDDGALLVRTEHGHLERIIGGDVTLEK